MKRISEPTKIEKQSRERIIRLIQDYCDGSQQRFVEKTGINKGSVSQYVNGSNVPSSLRAMKIADIFNVSPAWVMGFDVPMERSVAEEKAEQDVKLIRKFAKLNQRDKDLIMSMMDSMLQRSVSDSSSNEE